MIKVGTSGFSFPDWVGTVYPANIRKGEMLPYYEQKLGFKITGNVGGNVGVKP